MFGHNVLKGQIKKGEKLWPQNSISFFPIGGRQMAPGRSAKSWIVMPHSDKVKDFIVDSWGLGYHLMKDIWTLCFEF